MYDIMYYDCVFCFFKQKTAYEMRISDWSSTCALPIFDDAISLQKANPRIDTQEKRCPERKNDKQQQEIAPPFRRARHAISHWIGNEYADTGREKSNPNRIQIGHDIELIGEHISVVRPIDINRKSTRLNSSH